MKASSMSLVDHLALVAGCQYISDLLFLRSAERQRLKRYMQTIEPECFSVWEWQDALCYFSGKKAESTEADILKSLLLSAIWDERAYGS